MFWNPQSTMSPNGTQAGLKLCPYCAEEIQAQAVKCKHCHSWIGAPGFGAASGFAQGDASKASGVGLRRTVDDRKVFGVCGGLARSVGLDPTIVRVAYALATFFTGIVPGVIAYLIMTWAIPSEDDPRGMA